MDPRSSIGKRQLRVRTVSRFGKLSPTNFALDSDAPRFILASPQAPSSKPNDGFATPHSRTRQPVQSGVYPFQVYDCYLGRYNCPKEHDHR